MEEWNKEDFFSGVTEDYSHYRWYKGEKENPYLSDVERPLAAHFWEYERDYHFSFLDKANPSLDLGEEYKRWKQELLTEYLPGKSPNPNSNTTDWKKIFENGHR